MNTYFEGGVDIQWFKIIVNSLIMLNPHGLTFLNRLFLTIKFSESPIYIILNSNAKSFHFLKTLNKKELLYILN